MTSNSSIAILPYLKTSDAVEYKDLVFRNIDDTSGLSSELVDHLNVISQMFYLRNQFRIKKITYTIIPISSKDEDNWGDEEPLKQLREFQTIIAYLYSAPHQIFSTPFLSKEQASLFLFNPQPVPLSLIGGMNHLTENAGGENFPKPDNRGLIDGYEVILDFRSHLWVTRGSNIYPPVGYLGLNYSQDMYIDIAHRPHDSHVEQIFTFANSMVNKSELRQRIFTALDWYNRSNVTDIEDDIALVELAVAFECLLNLDPGEKITSRFTEAVSLLLGGLPRLESWLTQFYNARSQIVHKGHSINLSFLATDDPKKSSSGQNAEYRSLVSLGRQIFRLCLSTIIHGALEAEKMNLSSLLFTNQERLTDICEVLSKSKGTAQEKLKAVKQQIRDIDAYRFVGETGLKINSLIGTAQLTVKTYLETNPSLSTDLSNLLNEFITASKGSNCYDPLLKLQQIQDHPEAKQATERGSPTADVFLLLDCVWHYTFFYFYWLKES